MSRSWWKARTILNPTHENASVVRFLSPTEAGQLYFSLNWITHLYNCYCKLQFRQKRTKPVTLYLRVVCLHVMCCKPERGRGGHNTKTQISTINMQLYRFAQSDKSCGEETLWRCDYSNLCFECRRMNGSCTFLCYRPITWENKSSQSDS